MKLFLPLMPRSNCPNSPTTEAKPLGQNPWFLSFGSKFADQPRCLNSYFRAIAILILCYAICPTNIARFIIAIGIDPIKAPTALRPRRAFANICQEIFERIKPTITYFNATTTIAMICYMIRIIATSLHRSPNAIKRMKLFLALFNPQTHTFDASATANPTEASMTIFARFAFKGKIRANHWRGSLASVARVGADVPNVARPAYCTIFVN